MPKTPRKLPHRVRAKQKPQNLIGFPIPFSSNILITKHSNWKAKKSFVGPEMNLGLLLGFSMFIIV